MSAPPKVGDKSIEAKLEFALWALRRIADRSAVKSLNRETATHAIFRITGVRHK